MIEIDFNMEKEFEEFYLKTKDEVEVFQNFISEYLRSKNIMSLPNLDLLSIFDACNGKKNGERIFAMMLDIKINFILIWLDQNDAGAIWNQNFSKGKLEGGSVLDSRSKFYGKFEIHRFNSSFIFRYRAIWDKIMGVLVLLMLPADYNSFMGSKSKKKAFLKLSKKGSPLTEEYANSILDPLTKFDNEFRTPEAHKTGRLRKFSFSMDKQEKNPSLVFIGYWNMLLSQINQLDKIFESNK